MLRLFQICVVPPPHTHLLSHFLDQAAQPASPTSRWPALKSKKSKRLRELIKSKDFEEYNLLADVFFALIYMCACLYDFRFCFVFSGPGGPVIPASQI